MKRDDKKLAALFAKCHGIMAAVPKAGEPPVNDGLPDLLGVVRWLSPKLRKKYDDAVSSIWDEWQAACDEHEKSKEREEYSEDIARHKVVELISRHVCGNCDMAAEVAGRVRMLYASDMDVSHVYCAVVDEAAKIEKGEL